MTDKYDAKAREIACGPLAPCSRGDEFGHSEQCNRFTAAISSALRSAADEEREECAKIADKREKQNQIISDANRTCPQTTGFFGALAMEGNTIAQLIRSLKSNPKGEDHDAG